jgi:hypothetical protein
MRTSQAVGALVAVLLLSGAQENLAGGFPLLGTYALHALTTGRAGHRCRGGYRQTEWQALGSVPFAASPPG